MAEYLALEIGTFDTATGDTIRITENMMQLRRNYQAKRVEDIDHKAMMQALTTSESFENQGLRTSERIVITFELQDGEHPFRYLSCERIPQ